jgi:hypothetical protein
MKKKWCGGRGKWREEERLREKGEDRGRRDGLVKE